MSTIEPQLGVSVELKAFDRVREYLKERGIKGFISWEVVIKKEVFNGAPELYINTSSDFTKVFVNGYEYTKFPLTP